MDLSHNRIVFLGSAVSKHSCLESLAQLRVLILAHNSISALEFLNCLPQLEHLDLSHNDLQVIENLQHNPNLSYVNLANNNIKDLGSLTNNRYLRNLILDNNFISSLHYAPKTLPASLESLSLAGNCIEDLQSVTFLTKLTGLRYLDLAQNPFVKSSFDMGFDLRPFVIFLLRKVVSLNGVSVRKHEQSLADTLFSSDQGDLDDELLHLLKPGNAHDLLAYLCASCPLSNHSSNNNYHQSQKYSERDLQRTATLAWGTRSAAASFHQGIIYPFLSTPFILIPILIESL